MKVVVVASVLGAVIFGIVIALAAISGSATPALASTGTDTCVTSGPVAGLSNTAATNARIVAAVADQTGGQAGALVAVMTGYTESGLRVLGNPTVATGDAPTQGDGGNLDSIGIFQQRDTWGTVAQRLDPAISTELFMARLLADPSWRTKPLWVAAQDVQRSAYDGRPSPANGGSAVYGGNYQQNLPLAQRVVATIIQDQASHPCGTLTGGLPANSAPGSHGLPDSYAIPPSATPTEARVVAFAIAQLDKPYVFGAAGPGAFDCSGLTMAAWAQVGVQLPHQASAQADLGTSTTAEALVPGDLVLVPGDDGSLAAPGHVGLYIGDGLVLNAADEQVGIRVQTYANFLAVGRGLAALRHIE